jgi:GNAT superfamily N-acetyltransferase
MIIADYSPRWHDDVVKLADRVFGEGYFPRPWDAAKEAGATMLVCHEQDDRALLGFAQGRVLPRGSLGDYLEHRIADIPRDIADADARGVLGVLNTVAVAPEQRRRGIGTKLLRAIHDALIGQGADKLIVTFKRGPSASRVEGVMSRLGFAPWTRLPTYWQQRCDRGDFKCNDRRATCTCEALMFRKAVY